jgi:hypothetical protein
MDQCETEGTQRGDSCNLPDAEPRRGLGKRTDQEADGKHAATRHRRVGGRWRWDVR